MKNVYQVVIVDAKGVYQNVRVAAGSMADAVAAAQKKFGVTTEPQSVGNCGPYQMPPIDFEALT